MASHPNYGALTSFPILGQLGKEVCILEDKKRLLRIPAFHQETSHLATHMAY